MVGAADKSVVVKAMTLDVIVEELLKKFIFLDILSDKDAPELLRDALLEYGEIRYGEGFDAGLDAAHEEHEMAAA